MSRVVTKLMTVVLGGGLSLGVMAQGSTGYSAQTIIDDGVGVNAQGVLGVNMASGDSNLQSNATAFSAASGPAAAQTHILQTIDTGQFSVPDTAVTRIDGNAFGNAAGSIGVNQAAGAANAQANNVAIAIGAGAEVTADAELAQSVSGVVLPLAANGQYRETTVADTAFSGARGIVQINQAAGMANATGNSFALRVQMGAAQ
jgi:hypothetical protein